MIKSIPRLRLALPGTPAAILVLVAAALSAAPTVAAGSYGYGNGAGAATTGVAPASIQVSMTSTSALGAVLTGPSGMTLYTLSSDSNNGSVCTGGCLAAWPPLLVASGGTVTGPSGGSLTFSTFTRTDDSSVQASADGRPLYYFGGDSAPGQTNGEGIKGAGGVWHVASSAATSAANAAPAAAPAAAAGGGYGAVSGSDAAPNPATQAPASSGMDLPIGLVVLVLALVLIAVAIVAIRRTRPVGNG